MKVIIREGTHIYDRAKFEYFGVSSTFAQLICNAVYLSCTWTKYIKTLKQEPKQSQNKPLLYLGKSAVFAFHLNHIHISLLRPFSVSIVAPKVSWQIDV
jgi:hypothetical protein